MLERFDDKDGDCIVMLLLERSPAANTIPLQAWNVYPVTARGQAHIEHQEGTVRKACCETRRGTTFDDKSCI
jgi:hypothetical protein